MNADTLIISVIAVAGLVDVWCARFTGKSMVEWLTPRERRKA